MISVVCRLTEVFLTGEVGDPVLVTKLLVPEQGPDPDLVPVLLLLVVAGLVILNYTSFIMYYSAGKRDRGKKTPPGVGGRSPQTP